VSGRLDQRSWETQDGDKRSKIEIVADEVGPSLTYATAQVVRNERREGFEGGKSSGGGGGGGGSRPAPTNNSPAGYDDEEPF
jgi:single-strand DNA-binding protein